jgi:hypothetical protein
VVVVVGVVVVLGVVMVVVVVVVVVVDLARRHVQAVVVSVSSTDRLTSSKRPPL